MHPSAQGLTREQRVEQSRKGGRSVHDYRNYIPNGNAVEKLVRWKEQGAEIFYLTSRISPEQIEDIRSVLQKYKFPTEQNLLFRRAGEEYKDVAEQLTPDILVEDDCESIGGEVEMTYTYIRPKFKKEIKSVVVKEFGGIDHLPNELEELIDYREG